MPSNEDKSGADNSSLRDDLEIFETLFREELDALEASRKEKALLQPDGNESKGIRERIGTLEKTEERSHRLRIVLLAFLLTALGAFSINYFGILDLRKFMPFSERKHKAVVLPQVVRKSPVEVLKKPMRLPRKSPQKAGIPLSPDKATSQKVGPATKKRPMSTISKNGPSIIKKHPQPETTVEKPLALKETPESTTSTAKAGPKKTPPKTASPKKTARAGKPSRSAGRVYPYSVYLGSYRTTEGLQKAVSVYRKRGLSPYWVKIDLEEKGMWFRVFTGFFKTRREADAFIRENHIPGAATKHTKYTVLVGAYKSEEEVNLKKLELRAIGCCPYDVKDINGACRLYVGAFYQMVRAQKHKADLASNGIQGEVVER